MVHIRVSEGYFLAKYKTFPGSITDCFCFANVSAFFTFMHTHVCVYLSDKYLLADDKELAIYNHGQNIWDSSSFHVKYWTTGKFQFQFFGSLLLVLTKFLFREKDWALGYNSMKFWDFRVFPNFLRSKVLSHLATCEATRVYHVFY